MRHQFVGPAPADDLGREAQTLRELHPQRGKVTGLVHQHGIAGAQRIAHGRFPGAGARGGIDDHGMAGLEDRLHARVFADQVAELDAIVERVAQVFVLAH